MIPQTTTRLFHVLAERLRGMLPAAGALVLLAAGLSAQRSEVTIDVHCSNIPGMEGQGKIDSPRKIEIDVQITDPAGQVSCKTISAPLARDATARLGAMLLARQVNGQGSTPGQNSEITSANPDADDWVDRESKIILKLPDGVKPKKIRVYKMKGKKWVPGGFGHLRVRERVMKAAGGTGLLELARVDPEPFGLVVSLAPTGSSDNVLFEFERGYTAETATSTALEELGDMLTDQGFTTLVDGDSLWILESPWTDEIDVTYGVWHDDPPFDTDGEDGPATLGEFEGWSSVEASFTGF